MRKRKTNKQTQKAFVPVRSILEKFFRLLEVIPLGIPAAMAAFGVVAVVFLLFGALEGALVWPAGLVAATGAFILVVQHGSIERPGSRTEQRLCDGLVLLLVLLWGLFNIQYTSQHVFTNRDPAVYAVTGAWLIDNNDLNIPNINVFEGIEEITGSGAGFNVSRDDPKLLYAHGLHLLPAYLGMIGRVAGETVMLRSSVIFGMSALLAVYAFARLLMRPRWAVVAAATLGVSLPLIYFSRDTYTEPLAATFTFGALALLWVAQKTGLGRLWFLAGIVAGAGALTRIDAYLSVVALVLFAGVFLTLARRSERRPRLKNVGFLFAGIALVALFAWLDMSRLSTAYYTALRDRLNQEFLAIAGTLGLSAIMVLIGWRTRFLSRLDAFTRRWRAPVVAILVLVATTVLVSRPLWLVVRDNSAAASLVGSLQAVAGDEIDPMRKYSEYSTHWMAWYLGAFMAILGAVGLALSSAWSVKRRDLLLVPFILVFIVTAGIFLVQPNISPDHIWASRRFLPIVLPGLAIFGALALDYVDRKIFMRRVWLSGGFLLLAGWLAIGGAFGTSGPLLTARKHVQLPALHAVCGALPDKAAVLWVGQVRPELVQPTEIFCGKPTAGYKLSDNEQPDTKTLSDAARIAREKGFTPIVGLFEVDAHILGVTAGEDVTAVANAIYDRVELTLTRPPEKTQRFATPIVLGILQADGTTRQLDQF